MLNIGLLVDSVHSDRYVEELVLWARREPDLRISHLIVQPGGPPKATFAFERFLLRWSKAHHDHYAVRDLRGLVEHIVQAENVRSLELDLLIACGRERPSEALLAASRLGAIAFHHEQQGWAGFWECYRREAQTQFVIRRLAAGGDQVLARGAFKTHFYYSLNQAHIHKKAVSHLKRLLKKLAVAGELPAPQHAQAAGAAPGMAHCMLYGGKLACRILLKAIARLPMFRQRFGISLVPEKWDQPIRWRGRGTPAGRYWADPFLHARGGRTFCFVEDLDARTKRGQISALELVGGELVERGIALKEPFHLSFPFLFEYQGELYMCPESCEAREIRVYRCTDFPLKWRLEKTLMRGVSAADSLLFEKAGRWWMLTSIDQAETGDHCSELYLFSADSPLSTSWMPHRQNPILVDSIGGRNGGLIREGKRLYRLGQRQGFDRYGESLGVYEIKEISESRYTEELVRICGTHHLSTDGRATAFDHAWGL